MEINCIDFCVDEMLWMLSWGWYQLFLGICFLWFLYVFIMRMKLIPAFALTISSYAFAMIIYFAFVAGIFIHYFQWRFVAGEIPRVFNPLYASLFLSLIYSILQLLFYYLLRYWRHLMVLRLFVLSLLSNCAAALLSSCFIKITF